MIKYIYAIRDIKTNKLISAKCNKDKFYQKKKMAEDKIDKLNKYNKNFELVTFKIEEVKEKK